MWEAIGKITVLLFVGRILTSVLKGFYTSYLGYLLGFGPKFKKLGKWAVVTGATDGIGAAFAEEMARRGLDIVLISRSAFKLQNVAADLSKRFNVETKIIDVDFTNLDIYDRLKSELSSLDIGVLVNNVGISYSHPEYFTNVDNKVVNDILACNVHSVTNMTRIVLMGMKERKRGLILNISSLTSLFPIPLLSAYAGSKAFVCAFSNSLSLELEGSGVTVQCIIPGFVVSKMSKIRKSSLMAPKPLEYVRAALATAGLERITAGYYTHKLQVYGMTVLDRYLPSFVLNGIIWNSMSTIRKKSLKKLQKSQ